MSIKGSSFEVAGPAEGIVEEIKSSLSLKFGIVSLIMIILGGTIFEGVVAGMFGVFGATFLFISVTSYTYFWWSKRQWEEEVEEVEI